MPDSTRTTTAPFVERHLGPDAEQIAAMCQDLECADLEALADRVVPDGIRTAAAYGLPEPVDESAALAELAAIADANQADVHSLIGCGYHACVLPPVLQRNVLENPGWYTSYTPYQAEIAQGRLECLFHFQTLICELTACTVANASLLDEATAVSEAVAMAHGIVQKGRRTRFLIDAACHPQTVEVVRTRAEAVGLDCSVGDARGWEPDADHFAVVIQYPTTDGRVENWRELAERAHAQGLLVICAADPLGLVLLEPPAAWGADIVVGSSQRFGLSPGFGGPHAGFFACDYKHRRRMPGRISGRSLDARGEPAYRQALLANLSALYAIYHGPDGLRAIAQRVHAQADALAAGLGDLGYQVADGPRFDTVMVTGTRSAQLREQAAAAGYNLRAFADGRTGISLDETVSEDDLAALLAAAGGAETAPPAGEGRVPAAEDSLPSALRRDDEPLQQPVFHRHRSETAMLRFLKRLEERDISLTRSMIPLGSCTMKLNATAEMVPITWPAFAAPHPFAPAEQTRGYARLVADLEAWLAACAGLAATSLQPNSGAQGEYAGLLTIRAWQRARGQGDRDVCLLPVSAHGTNPASAVMAGMRVVNVACDGAGNIDLEDLRRLAAAHADDLACIMVTYPSTHGVFESGIDELCRIVHAYGGQVYMDGANLNAQLGLTSPGVIGVDICHLNLHKTFAIPHGGGGPGVGPICAAEHLVPHLPGHWALADEDRPALGTIAAAPYGSACILPITWMYLRMMGAEGLRRASQVAILNANYLARHLDTCFPVLYRGESGLVAHECILDPRPLEAETGIGATDVAKRLMDYGFHAPTVSFPVPGTLMVEPTESEDRAELDRFIAAMISIRAELDEVAQGVADPEDNLLKNAPHPATVICADTWPHPYSRERAAFPLPWLRRDKYWPPVGRVDEAQGDRKLVCYG